MSSLRHPTPEHIKECILEAFYEHNNTADSRKTIVPYVAQVLVKEAIARACLEHDADELEAQCHV